MQTHVLRIKSQGNSYSANAALFNDNYYLSIVLIWPKDKRFDLTDVWVWCREARQMIPPLFHKLVIQNFCLDQAKVAGMFFS